MLLSKHTGSQREGAVLHEAAKRRNPLAGEDSEERYMSLFNVHTSKDPYRLVCMHALKSPTFMLMMSSFGAIASKRAYKQAPKRTTCCIV